MVIKLVESLQQKMKVSEKANFVLKNNYEDASIDCETYTKQIEVLEAKVKDYEQKAKIREADLKKQNELNTVLQHEKENIESESENAEKKWKELTEQ
jgi:hypothetical protein